MAISIRTTNSEDGLFERGEVRIYLESEGASVFLDVPQAVLEARVNQWYEFDAPLAELAKTLET